MALELSHCVLRETLLAECQSEEDALRIRGALGDMNERRFVPVIERVLAEMNAPDLQIRIERLEIDLGEIDIEDLEEVAPERLYAELKSALERAMASPFSSASRPHSAARLEILESFLLRGIVPLDEFSLDEWIEETGADELARLIRRTGVNDYVLERIVQQASARVLQRLISVLDPEHSALIVSYLLDVREVHHREPLAAIDESELDRLLWFLALSFLVREAGSQFNRREFVGSLLRGFAAAYGIRYEDTLALFAAALAGVQARYGFRSSLPAVIADLVGDVGAQDPEKLAELVRLRASDTGWLETLVASLDEKTLVRLIAILEPAQPAMIIAFLFDVRDVGREAPAFPSDPARFELLLWVVSVSFVVEERGSEFNRKAFLGALLRRVANNAGLEFAGVLAIFKSGLDRAARKQPLRSSLQATLASLFEDIARDEPEFDSLLRAIAPEPAEDAEAHLQIVMAAVSGMDSAAVRRLLFHVLPAAGTPGPLAEALRYGAGAGEFRSFYARLISSALRKEPLDFEAPDALMIEAGEWNIRALKAAITTRLAPSLIRVLLRRDQSEGRVFLRSLTANSATRDRLIRNAGADEFESILDLLAGANAQAIRALPRGFAQLPASDRPSLERIRAVLLAECLRGGAAREAEPAFFRRVFAALFPAPLPERIRVALAASTPQELSALRIALQPENPRKTIPVQPRFMPSPEVEPREPIYVANAGIVLAAPFLPHLFNSLDFLEAARWRSNHFASRAVHLIQYLVDERTSAPEPVLALNKVLCGLGTEWPAAREIEIQEQERSLCDQLMRALISRWESVSNSSPAAIRETFFQREGKLEYSDGKWTLAVQRKTVDVLVDQAPWSCSFILHDWMREPLHVTW